MARQPLGRLISILHRREQRYVNQRLQEENLGFTAYNFILYLFDHQGCSQKELCRALFIDEALATRKVQQLETEGYVRRVKEGRGYALFLTTKGIDILPQLQRILEDWWLAVLRDFHADETELLLDQLEHMAKRAIQLTEHTDETKKQESR